METLFLTLVRMSVTASWVIAAILLVRCVFRKAPKAMIVALWGLVAVRLLCPFSIESNFSLLPVSESLIPNDVYEKVFSSEAILAGQTEKAALSSMAASEPHRLCVITAIWIVGMLTMLVYLTVSYRHLHRKLREAVRLEDNVWLCDRIDTPFILGMIRPRIFLPCSMSETEQKYALAHERAHLQRGDHLWKPIGFCLLSVYWFQPMLWIAYRYLCKDIELACDEKVMRTLGVENKKLYAQALINCSVSCRLITACPLAFGEMAVQERIKAVLHYKRPTFWILLTMTCVCAFVAVSFLTDPLGNASADVPLEETVNITTLSDDSMRSSTKASITTTTNSMSTTVATMSSALGSVASTTTAITRSTTEKTSTTVMMATKATSEKPTTTVDMTTVTTTSSLPTTTTTVIVHDTEYIDVLSITPNPVEQGETVTIRVAISSEQGIQSANALLYRGPITNIGNVYAYVPLTLIEGDAHNGIYVGVYTISQEAPTVDWRVSFVATSKDGSLQMSLGDPEYQRFTVIAS